MFILVWYEKPVSVDHWCKLFLCYYSHQRASCKGLWSKQRVNLQICAVSACDVESFWGCFVDSSLCLQCESSNVCVRVCVRLWHLFTSVSVRLSEWSALWDLTFKYKSLSSPLSLSLPLWPCVTGSARANTPSRWIWTLTAILCLFKSLTVFFIPLYILTAQSLTDQMLLFWLF